jgi:LacI family transcriptional regulator
MVTIHDIAKRAHVSIATVSAVVNSSAYVSPSLKERVLEALEELDYHPDEIARSLKSKRTRTLGLIISDITNPFFTAVVRGVEDVANRSGYAVILCNTDEDPDKERTYLKVLRSRRVDGLIMAPSVGKKSCAENLRFQNIPVVFIDRVPATCCTDAVVVDNVGGAFEAVAHLIKLGHRRIGIITGLQKISTTQERLEGYTNAFRTHKLRINKEWIKEGNSRLSGGYEKGLELLETRNRPSAIFVTNNLMTIGLMKAIVEKGLSCPEDISVVGFDDFDWAGVFRPRLTAVSQPTYEMGSKAAELLVSRIAGKKGGGSERINLSPTLIIRDSCRNI